MKRWQKQACGDASYGAPAAPEWSGHVPFCALTCPHHDGKRCELLGVRAHEGLPCEPVVTAMALMLNRSEART
jgi:hypothetical protein